MTLTVPCPDTSAAEAEAMVRSAARSLPSISLPELLATAALQTRTDRKYVVDARMFTTFVRRLDGELMALDIGGTRLFDYESVYFDSEDWHTYRAHLQGRRRRFKLRTRTYVDSGECMLEVKLEGRRAATVKHRVPHPLALRGQLTPEAADYVADILESAYGVLPPPGLRPVMITRYRRATLACISEVARLTCDVGLVCATPAGTDDPTEDGPVLRTRGGQVIVESKSVGGSVADRMLRDMGVRPLSMSKYCLGIAGLHPELRSNPWRRVLHRHFDMATRDMPVMPGPGSPAP